MANIRLTVQPLARNDIAILANLFEMSFDYYINHNSPFFVDYLKNLRTLIGLGFAATLADKSLLSIYQYYLNNFMAHEEGNFKTEEGAKRLIAQSSAEMIASSTISFSALDYPSYYEDFMKALHHTVAKVPEFTEMKMEAARILSYLTVKRW